MQFAGDVDLFGIETRLTPGSLAATRCGFTFHVACPTCSIWQRRLTCRCERVFIGDHDSPSPPLHPRYPCNPWFTNKKPCAVSRMAEIASPAIGPSLPSAALPTSGSRGLQRHTGLSAIAAPPQYCFLFRIELALAKSMVGTS